MATAKGAEKWKQKVWLDVHAPQSLGNEIIGSVPSNDEEHAIGKTIKVSLSWLTHNPNHAFFSVGLKINNAAGSVANTDVAYLEGQYGYLHSLVKRHATSIYTNDKVKTKDGKEMTAKLLVTTQNKIAEKKKKEIRKKITEFLTGYAASHDKDEIVKSAIGSEMQKDGTATLKKIAPIAKLEIKKVEF